MRVPDGARVIDAGEKYVMPGLVDAMTYYGIARQDLNETTSPITPELQALEAYYPFGKFGGGPAEAPRAEDLLSGGVTTQYIAPADATIVGGQGAVVKTAGPDFASLIVQAPAAVDMTLGANPAGTFREKSRTPSTRMAVMSELREALIRAQEYERRVRAYDALPEDERQRTPPPPRDLGMEALGRLLRGEVPARVQANRAVEIRNAMQLAEEFGFELIIDSGISADDMAGDLAARSIPVVLGPISHPYVSGQEIPDTDEYPHPDEDRAARLVAAGVKVAIASFFRSFGELGPNGTGQWLLLDAALAGGYGLRADEILRAVTLNPAEILGIADRVGSLEVGKDADVIILDGPPLSVRTRVERVFVNGREVYVGEAPSHSR